MNEGVYREKGEASGGSVGLPMGGIGDGSLADLAGFGPASVLNLHLRILSRPKFRAHGKKRKGGRRGGRLSERRKE